MDQDRRAMDLERRLSEALHHVADTEHPNDLVSKALVRVHGHGQHRRSLLRPAFVLAGAAAGLVLVALAVGLLWRGGLLPPAAEPTPTPTLTPAATPAVQPSPTDELPPCPVARIEGWLVTGPPGVLALLVEPFDEQATPMEVTWEPAYFSIVDEGGQPAVADRDGRVIARIGDLVALGGGMDQHGTGWYACGSLEVIEPGQATPGEVTDDPLAWRALAAIDRHLSLPIQRVLRLAWEGDALQLVIVVGRADSANFVSGAMSQAGFTGRASDNPSAPGQVTVELTNARSVLSPSPAARCGEWWRFELRAQGDGSQLSGASLAAAADVMRQRAGLMMDGFATERDVFVTVESDQLVVEIPLEPGMDEGVLEMIRRSLVRPAGVEFMTVPDGVPSPTVRGDPAGLDPLFGGAGIDDARMTVDQAGRPAVLLHLRPDAAAMLDDYAADHIGGQLALVTEGSVVAAPAIRARRFDGEVMVTLGGDLDLSLSLYVAERLRIGVDLLEFDELHLETVRRDC